MINIAIDGPAGAGKSTIAREAAKRLEFIYVDTGAMYRALALACLRKNIDASDEAAVSSLCADVTISIKYIDSEQRVLLDGENVNDYIRSEEVSQMTSAISVYKEVRQKLLSLQRDLAGKENVIMDGRDIGTHVLPEACVKIYLTASVKVRAARRFEQLADKDGSAALEEIEKEILERDHRDMNRKIAPLKQAEDAVLFDTSDYSIEEVIQEVIRIINEKLEGK